MQMSGPIYRRTEPVEEIKYEKEIIISTWINELDLNMKTYDIVRIMRHPEDYSCSSIHNEIFNIAPETEQIRCLMNPRKHHKTVTCLVPKCQDGDRKVFEELNKIRAPMYVSDHRDKPLIKKIPAGYKIIGIRGFKGTSDDMALHIGDFLIWQPQPGWLDFSLNGQAKRDAAESERNKKRLGLAREWLLNQNS